MSKASDTYKTIARSSDEILYKEKKSKFYASAFPIQTENEVKPIIELLKKKHHTAGHVCYAWQLGVETLRYRANDDGEPNNSAGLPIYGQIQAFEVTNVLVAVARIFGGTKLGVGGLISTYRTAAQMALEETQILEKVIEQHFSLSFGYDAMDKVMRIIKQQQFRVISQQLELNCELVVGVRKNQALNFTAFFKNLHKVHIKKIQEA